MEWGFEQEQVAEAKVKENSASMMSSQDTGVCLIKFTMLKVWRVFV